ncbi:MAG TPA: hypothetical protein VF391_05645 [Dermatophilaceae bacterium]|jgi:hypothetical protein
MSVVAADSEGAWDRRRLLVILVSAGLTAALLAVGLGYAMYSAVTSTVTAAATGNAAGPAVGAIPLDTPVRGQAHRDTVSAATMLRVSPDDSRQGTPAAAPLPTITIPPATQAGPVQVSTGFPHTSEGAVGQLAAIETAVLQAMSIAQATEVYGAWAMPGGVGAPQWELTGAVQAFLGSRSGGQAKAITTVITATPAAGLVKGADGDDWVLACVLLDVRAVVATEARIGYGHCERMQWAAGRWLIGPGPAPARAPSTWPGTDLARQAGWRTWTPAGPE